MAGPTPVSTRRVESVVLPGKELFGNKNPGPISSTHFPSTGGEARVTIHRALALENKGSVEGSGRAGWTAGPRGGSAISELASFHSLLKVGQWSRSLLCEPSRGGELPAPLPCRPAPKLEKSRQSLYTGTEGQRKALPRDGISSRLPGLGTGQTAASV